MIEKIFFSFIFIGYSVMSRSAAYLFGIPHINIYLSEAIILSTVVFRPGLILGRLFGGLVSENSFISLLCWSMFAFLCYGLVESIRGLLSGYAVFNSLAGFVFNFYTLYFFVGLWLGSRFRNLVPDMIRLLAWANGIYGVLYLLLLSDLATDLTIPGSPKVPIFGSPGGSNIAIVGLLLLERKLGRVWLPLVLNIFVIMGMQIRAEWLALFVGFVLVALLARHTGRLVIGALVAVSLLLLLEATNLQIMGRTEVLSLPAVVAQAVAPIAPDLADDIYSGAARHAGTSEWRLNFWTEVWKETHGDFATAVFGLGYGYPLASVVDDLSYYPLKVRTPHNFLIYALGYTGWFGVLLCVLFQLALARLLWHVYSISGNPIGFVIWSMGISKALFSNFFETPFNAIPFFLLTGMAAAPLILTTYGRGRDFTLYLRRRPDPQEDSAS